MFHLFSVGCVVVITDKAHYCRAICGLHNVVSSGPDTAVAGHKGEQQWTQETALWGAGAREITLEVLSPTRTDWGLSVRKSSSQLYRGALKPSWASLLTRCCGMMVLNTELKFRNNIHTCVFLHPTVHPGFLIGLCGDVFHHTNIFHAPLNVCRHRLRILLHPCVMIVSSTCLEHIPVSTLESVLQCFHGSCRPTFTCFTVLFFFFTDQQGLVCRN